MNITDIFVVTTTVDGKSIIGTGNSNVNGNGAKTRNLPPILNIPSVIDELNIEEIGCNAFMGLYVIKEITISNGIKKINNHAFANLHNLENVVIPPSVTYIGDHSFHCYNTTVSQVDAQPIDRTGKGTLTVTFLPDSQISFIDSKSICRKLYIKIYFLGKKSPKYNVNPFYSEVCISIKVYSSTVSRFCGIKTISYCTVSCKRRNNQMILFVIALIDK